MENETFHPLNSYWHVEDYKPAAKDTKEPSKSLIALPDSYKPGDSGEQFVTMRLITVPEDDYIPLGKADILIVVERNHVLQIKHDDKAYKVVPSSAVIGFFE